MKKKRCLNRRWIETTRINDQYFTHFQPHNLKYTLSTWLKKKESIINAYQQCNPKRKNTITSTFNDVETAILKLFKSARDKNIPISGPMLTAQAE